MKTLKGFVNEEQINESVAEIITLTSSMVTIICQLMILTGFSIVANAEGMFDDIKYWWRDKKIRKVAKRLAEDSEIKAFLDQPKSKQKGWKKLIETKLSDEEKKYLHSISKNKVSQNYK